MNIHKIKEMLKNKVKIITGSVAGVLVLTLAGTMLVHNKKAENKNIAIEKNTEKDNILDDKKEKSTNEDKDNKEKLEELKKIDTSNLSEEEKNDLENKIADMENKIQNKEDKEVASNTSTSNSSTGASKVSSSESSSPQNSSSSSTSNNSQSSGSTTINQTSSENSNSNGGSTSGGTSTQTQTHTHNWVPVTTVVHHDEEGHWENVLVSEAWTEEVPIYEEQERAICNGCGADITNNTTEHNMNHMLNGEKGGWHTEWQQVQVGTNKINHDAVYDKKWVVDKADWDETVTTGYRCSSCGETK